MSKQRNYLAFLNLLDPFLLQIFFIIYFNAILEHPIFRFPILLYSMKELKGYEISKITPSPSPTARSLWDNGNYAENDLYCMVLVLRFMRLLLQVYSRSILWIFPLNYIFFQFNLDPTQIDDLLCPHIVMVWLNVKTHLQLWFRWANRILLYTYYILLLYNSQRLTNHTFHETL